MNSSSSSRVVAIAMVVLVLFTGTRSFAETESLSADPMGLTRLLRKFAKDYVAEQADPIEARLRELVTYTAVSALVDNYVHDSYQVRANVAEAARTDRQGGGGSSSAASTRLTEKAGNNATLGLAIENGAIRQESRVAQLTLSTSLYAFISPAGGGDTQKSFDRYNAWRRFGFSGTFDLSNAEAATVGNLDTEDFSEFGFRIRILGDRSTRTARFRTVWEERELPQILELLSNQRAANVPKTEDDKEEKLDPTAQVTDVVDGRLDQEYEKYSFHNPKATEAERQQSVYSILLKILMEEVYEPVESGQLLADGRKRRAIIDKIYPELRAELATETLRPIKDLVRAYNQGESILTFDYALHRIDSGSDFSELKVVYQNFVYPFDIAFNGFLNLNHNPSADLDPEQQTVREYGATLSLDVNIHKVFAGLLNSRPITLTASGEVSRLQDVRDMFYAAQVRMDFPVVNGFTVPVTLNYGSRTETNESDEFTVTIGGGVELDAILAAVRARNFANAIKRD